MRDTPDGVSLHLLRCGEHIFNKDTVPGGGVGDEDVGDGADDFTVLKDEGAAHVCVNIGPTNEARNHPLTAIS